MDRCIDHQFFAGIPVADTKAPDLPLVIGGPDTVQSRFTGIFLYQTAQIPHHIVIVIQLIFTADDPWFFLHNDLDFHLIALRSPDFDRRIGRPMLFSKDPASFAYRSFLFIANRYRYFTKWIINPDLLRIFLI